MSYVPTEAVVKRFLKEGEKRKLYKERKKKKVQKQLNFSNLFQEVTVRALYSSNFPCATIHNYVLHTGKKKKKKR